jgi:hypothetical protein
MHDLTHVESKNDLISDTGMVFTETGHVRWRRDGKTLIKSIKL